MQLSRPFITRTFSLGKMKSMYYESGTAHSLPPQPWHPLSLLTPDASQEPLSFGFLGQLIPLRIKSSGPKTSLISYFNMHTFLYIFVIMVFTQISSFLEDVSPSFPVVMQSSKLISKGYIVTSKADSVGFTSSLLTPGI